MNLAATDDTSSRILAAADTLFGERGYDAVSVRDIAEHAGVNKALVFYHHGTKEALFAKVIEHYYEAHRKAIEGAFEGEAPVRDRLHQVIDTYLDFIAAHRHYPRLIQRVVAGSGAPIEPVQKNLAVLYSSVYRVLSQIAPEHGPRAARHLFVTFSGAVINFFTYGPLLAPAWGVDPLSDEGIEERRVHLHWVADCLMDGLSDT